MKNNLKCGACAHLVKEPIGTKNYHCKAYDKWTGNAGDKPMHTLPSHIKYDCTKAEKKYA